MPQVSGMHGDAMTRRLMIGVLILFSLLGWLGFTGRRLGWYGEAIAVMITVMLNMLIAIGAIRVVTRKLIQMEERAGLILENAIDAFIAIDEKGKIVEWNRQSEKIFGWPRAEAMGKLLIETIIPERYRHAHRECFQRFLATGKHKLLNQLLEIECLRHDGSEFPVELSIVPLRQNGKYFFNASLRDISERKRVQSELQQLTAELEARVTQRTAQLAAANQELESFSYSVSHDLRVPLRAIDGFSRILAEDYAGKIDEEGKRIIQVVRDNCRKMGKLIDDLLSFSRLGRKPLSMAEVNMVDLANEAIRELSGSGVTVPAIAIDPLPPAYGDRQLIFQVWLNLLSNAVKFSGNRINPVILIRGQSDQDENIYHVTDNGVGFDMQYADQLFGVFQRLHRADEFPGTGVGLAIVQRIVVRHGGRVWAESKPDAGATFSFSLPKESDHA